jgi:hypothetical protein
VRAISKLLCSLPHLLWWRSVHWGNNHTEGHSASLKARDSRERWDHILGNGDKNLWENMMITIPNILGLEKNEFKLSKDKMHCRLNYLFVAKILCPWRMQLFFQTEYKTLWRKWGCSCWSHHVNSTRYGLHVKMAFPLLSLQLAPLVLLLIFMVLCGYSGNNYP